MSKLTTSDYSRLFDLTGKVAVVTGGAGILGRQFCAGLAAHGARVALVDLQKAVAETVDLATRNAPAGSDVAVAALKSSMAAATNAFDSFTKAARNAASFTDAGVKAAVRPRPRPKARAKPKARK